MRKNVICSFSLLLLYWILVAPCFAGDNLSYLDRSARLTVEAKLLDYVDGKFTFLCSDGVVIVLISNDLTYSSNDAFTVHTTTNEIVSGSISVGNGKLFVNSMLGKLSLPMRDIRTISRKYKNIDSLADMRAKGTGNIEHNKSYSRIDNDQGGKIEYDDLSELYLRDRKVMTRKGNIELETNLSFNNDDKSAPLLGPDKTRQLFLSFTGRYGITDDLSAHLTIPVGAAWRETSEEIGQTSSNSTSGLGDITMGFYYQLLNESIGFPSLMLTVSAKSKTGKTVEPNSKRSGLGSGYWEISPGLSLVRTLDPIILFGGITYNYIFSDVIQKPEELESASDRVRHKPGDSINVLLGTGFSLNNKVSLSFTVNGGYFLRDKYDGSEVGDTRTPFYFRSGVNYVYSKNCYLEPSVSFGITGDASNFSISLAHVYRF